MVNIILYVWYYRQILIYYVVVHIYEKFSLIKRRNFYLLFFGDFFGRDGVAVRLTSFF